MPKKPTTRKSAGKGKSAASRAALKGWRTRRSNERKAENLPKAKAVQFSRKTSRKKITLTYPRAAERARAKAGSEIRLTKTKFKTRRKLPIKRYRNLKTGRSRYRLPKPARQAIKSELKRSWKKHKKGAYFTKLKLKTDMPDGQRADKWISMPRQYHESQTELLNQYKEFDQFSFDKMITNYLLGGMSNFSFNELEVEFFKPRADLVKYREKRLKNPKRAHLARSATKEKKPNAKQKKPATAKATQTRRKVRRM